MNLIILGDSLLQYNDESTYPQSGWIQACKSNKINIVNLAKNGRSTKSFINESRFSEALSYSNNGDYAIISFGHNDEKVNDETRYTSYDEYKNNLRFMVNELRKKGTEPILVSSVIRRHFNNLVLDKDTHLLYPLKMEEVAKELNVLYIDMNNLSYLKMNELGIELTKEIYMYNINNDNTHLTIKGAEIIYNLFLNELIKINHPLVELLK